MKIISLLMLSVVLTGCLSSSPIKLYEGPDIKASDLSTIGCGYFVRITAIDGKEQSNVKKFCRFSVLPGLHTVTYKDFEPAENNKIFVYNKKHKIQFITRKGYTYKIAVTRPKNKRTFWLYELDKNGKTTTEKVKYKEIKI